MSKDAPRRTTQQLRAVARIPARTAGGIPAPDGEIASRSLVRGRLPGVVVKALQNTPERALRAAVGRRPDAPRVVAFVSTKGGVGTTSTAVGVALALAEVWPLKVALADTRTGTASLGQLLSGAPVQDPMTFAAGIVELTRPAGMTLVDSAPWDMPLSRPMLARLVNDLVEHHLFTLLDVGHGGTEMAQAALARADRVVVVTTGAADAATGLAGITAQLSALDRLDRAVVAVVRAGGLGPHQDRLPSGVQPPGETVQVPWDPAFTTGRLLEIGRLRRRTRLAYLRLAAQCVR